MLSVRSLGSVWTPKPRVRNLLPYRCALVLYSYLVHRRAATFPTWLLPSETVEECAAVGAEGFQVGGMGGGLGGSFREGIVFRPSLHLHGDHMRHFPQSLRC